MNKKFSRTSFLKTSRAFTLIEAAIVLLIIGLIIASVIAADQMISKARISAAQNLTKASPLTATPGSIFWLESSTPTSFELDETYDGKSLSTWKDNNENSEVKNNAIAGSSAPTYANTINRIHATKFENGQHFLINGASLNNSDYTIIIVEKRLSNSSSNYFIGDPTVSTSNQTLLLGYDTNSKIIHSQGSGNSYTSNVEGYEDSKGKPRITVFTSSSAGKKTYINGVLAASSNDTEKLSNISNLAIGKGYNGEIGEVAAFSRALTDAERSEIEDYLAKKYEIKKYSGSCINGTVKIGAGCTYDTCSISVQGSSSSTVKRGSGSVNCNQDGYSGTVSYDCSMGIASVLNSETCSCATNYTLSSGSCVRVCSVSVTGSSTTSVSSGSSAISCDQTGYTGTVANSCSSSSTTVTGTCSCASGYTLSGGVCAKVCSVNVTGSSATTTSAGSVISCDQTGYTGTVANSCSPSNATVTGTCSCATNYTLSGGACVGSCGVSVVGSNATSATVGGSAISCNQTGYTGTVANSCTTPGGSVTGTCSCASGYTLSSGACTQITCSIAAANGFAAKTGLAYAASATAITSPCQSGYTESTPAPTYTCTTSGAASVTGSCTAITCTASAGTGYNAQSGLPYAASGTGTFNCNATGYTGTKNYTCTAAGAATITGGTCSCATNYTLSGGACVGSCGVSVVGSNATSATVGGSAISCNQTGYTGTVANSCTTPGGSVTGTCSCASGYTLSGGVCTPITCSIAAANGFAAKTGLAYAASATAITSPCQSGYTESTPAPTYTCTTTGAAVLSGTCSRYRWSTGSYNSRIKICNGANQSASVTCDQSNLNVRVFTGSGAYGNSVGSILGLNCGISSCSCTSSYYTYQAGYTYTCETY